ncbi:MAG: class I SAM-dependent methyltransferase [Methylococcales symbiont of Hymedesmia sp. n. MRB-2018]|nr:MAG: class I SAM-dependent methyltransferase [Methylococcales symbiont of Hymedesmia sp. n. MRB-2018]
MNEVKISEDLKGNYEDYYEGGDSEWRWLGAIDKAQNISTLCKGLPINSVIEIGAGEGSILKRLSELKFAAEFYALEISPTGVATIKNKNIPNLQECTLFDGYNISYENEKFDLAILSHVIEHVEYPRKLLYEAKRIAKFVFVEMPLEDSLRLSQDFIFDKVGHINFYSPKTIRRLIQTCNLEVIEQLTTNPSKDTYTFQKGRKGLINFYIKEYLLRFFPFVATELFTYHSSLICRDSIEKQDT